MVVSSGSEPEDPGSSPGPAAHVYSLKNLILIQITTYMEHINSIDDNISSGDYYEQLKEELAELKESIEKQDPVLENLRSLTTEIATKENEEFDLPLDSQTGRLDMEEYVKRGVYTPENVNGDKDTLRQLERKWLDKITPNNKKECIEKEINGEKIELLTMTTLYKFFKNKFLITRSARYDDVDNGVDTVIFNKDTGNVVCTLDESGILFGHYAERKRLRVLDKNEKGGARLKYGLMLTEDSEGQNHIKGSQVKNIPVFDLLMDSAELNKHLPEVSHDLTQICDFEKILFVYFMKTINSQVNKMQDPVLNIPSEVKHSAQGFKSEIENLYPNIFYSEDIIVSRKQGMLKPDFYVHPRLIINKVEQDTFREKIH